MPDDKGATENASALFPRTSWGCIRQAADPTDPEHVPARRRVAEAYRWPVFCFIRALGHQPADAEDLTQQFFLVLVEKDWGWLQRADPDQGRFRTLLVKVLKAFLCDQGPRAPKQRHFEQGQVSLSAADRAYEPPADVLPEVEFDRQWLCELTRKVLADLERSSHTPEERAGYKLLLARQYSERSAEHPSREQVAANHGLTVHRIRRAEETVRKRFVCLLRMEIREQVNSEAEVDEDVAWILQQIIEARSASESSRNAPG
jgi:RNA polymerase sigma-70 factor (ECF subfamily)